MGKSKPLTVSLYIGGKKIERLTEEECARQAAAASAALSLYYAAHPEEFEKLQADDEHSMPNEIKNKSKGVTL